MARMPDISGDLGEVEGFASRAEHHAADTMRHLMGIGPHHHDAPQPAAQPPVPHNDNQEVTPMSFIDEAESHAHAILDVFGQVDREALRLMEAVKGNSGALALVQAVEGYLHLPPQAFDVAISGLASVAKLYPGDTPQQPPQDTGPQVGGQA